MSLDDPYISTAEASLEGLAAAGVPGDFLVDLIPILKYVPSWVPGAGFQKKAVYWRAANMDMLYKPWNAMKENSVSLSFSAIFAAINPMCSRNVEPLYPLWR